MKLVNLPRKFGSIKAQPVSSTCVLLTQYLRKPHLVWKKRILSLPNAKVENGMFLIMFVRF